MTRQRLIILLVLVAVAAVIAAAFMYILPLDLQDRSPVQPIAFSHKIHAGDNGIHCLFCHRTAPVSPSAGLPAVETCRECHRFISPDAPEIGKIESYASKGAPIPWVRVYWVPDHVYFPHMMHVRAGLACADCHGNVAGMQRVSRKVKLEMGWCLACHRRKQVGIDCWMCHK